MDQIFQQKLVLVTLYPSSHPYEISFWICLKAPHAKSWLIGKDSDAGRDWGQEEKGTTEDEMAGWHHWLDGHESQWTPGVGDGQGGLACCNSWDRKELDTTERLIWSDLIWSERQRIPWTAWISNQSILKEINPEYSLERLKLKLQYFGYLMQRANSLEKTLMLGKVRRRRGNRGWDDSMASPTLWTWVWVSSRRWWRTGKPGVLQSMGLQRVGLDWVQKIQFWS